jgi:hypothetical protein
MRIFFPNILNLGKAFTGSAQSFKFIHNNLQIRVHQSVVGPNPVAQEWEKKLQKKSTQAKPSPAVPWGFKFIQNNLQTWVHQSATGPNPVAQEWEKNFK